MSFLSKLQNKPPKEKRKLLWILVCIGTALIFISWVTIFPKDYLNNGENQKSLADIKELYDSSEQNKQFDQYMDSLKIFDDFNENFDFENLLQGTPDENRAEDIEANKSINQLTEDNKQNRLPLELEKE